MSTEHCIGLNDQRSSSRVLKPPGGGHSNIFSPPEEIKPHARPKYDQQNSSNLNFCMNTVDPNEKVTKVENAPDAASDPQEAAPQESSDGGAQVSFSEAADTGKSGAALPTYHHHRSTALW
ncbi:unnamed protein product [Chironomus riparius]|uniref:Uncharacterized protein n=1 Tax=Chironomus riparius TaxID=315576 RepID=A0A9N9RWI2_9DIPT|nr:unnamed protein product [Chironomus riparius]